MMMVMTVDLDCPKSGPGPVQRYFAGPGPGPLGLGRHVLALMKKIKIYTFIEPSYGTTYNHLEKNFFPV